MFAFSTWITGFFNGYTPEFPTHIKYPVMSLTTLLCMAKVYTELPKVPIGTNVVGSAIVVGSIFCVGHHIGKGVRECEDKQTGPVRFKLLG